MSRVGKKPVPVPSGVTATVDGQMVKVKGTKGELSFVVPEEVSVALADGAVAVNPRDESKTARAKWGMSRAQVANLVEGVSKGFEKRLEINGVGYKAAVAGKVLKLSLGYSHDIDYAIPAGVTITTPRPTEVVVAGIDKQVVGQTAAEIREYRGPEPYKGKGVKYSDEFIFRKEGKKKKGRRIMAEKKGAEDRRKARVRRAIKKAANGRPRLSVFRSSKQIYAQVIDDVRGHTVASASTLEADVKGKLKTGATVDAAKEVGKLVAERAVQAGVKQVIFDRSGYLYHGRVKALADAAREGGLDF